MPSSIPLRFLSGSILLFILLCTSLAQSPLAHRFSSAQQKHVDASLSLSSTPYLPSSSASSPSGNRLSSLTPPTLHQPLQAGSSIFSSTSHLCSLPNSVSLLALPLILTILFPLIIIATILLSLVKKQSKTKLPIICNAAANQPSYTIFNSGLSICAVLTFIIVLLLHIRILSPPQPTFTLSSLLTIPDDIPPDEAYTIPIEYTNPFDLTRRYQDDQLNHTSVLVFAWFTFIIGALHALSLIFMGATNYLIWPDYHNLSAFVYIGSGGIYQALYTALVMHYLTPNTTPRPYAEPDSANLANGLRIAFATVSCLGIVLMGLPGYLETQRQILKIKQMKGIAMKPVALKFKSGTRMTRNPSLIAVGPNGGQSNLSTHQNHGGEDREHQLSLLGQNESSWLSQHSHLHANTEPSSALHIPNNTITTTTSHPQHHDYVIELEPTTRIASNLSSFSATSSNNTHTDSNENPSTTNPHNVTTSVIHYTSSPHVLMTSTDQESSTLATTTTTGHMSTIVKCGCIPITSTSTAHMKMWALLQYIALTSTICWFGLFVYDFQYYCILY